MTIVNNALGDALKKSRGKRSLYQLSKESEVDRGQLRRYEQGKVLPETKMLPKLAATYDIEIKDLYFFYWDTLYPHNTELRNWISEWARKKK